MRIGTFLLVLMFSFTAVVYTLTGLFGRQPQSTLIVDDHLLEEWGSRYPSMHSLREKSLTDNYLSNEEISQLRREYLAIKQDAAKVASAE